MPPPQNALKTFVALCFLAAPAFSAQAQTGSEADSQPPATPSGAIRAGEEDRPSGEPLAPMAEERAPLLREGSFIVRAIGTLHRDTASRYWIFRLQPDEPGDIERELILIPCELLEEIERMTEAAAGRRLTLEMTGEVFVYGDRNYLMPTHPPLVVDHEAMEEVGRSETPEADGDGGDRAEDIIRELERAAGPRARRPEARGRAGASAETSNAWREGTLLVERRGQVRRSADGAYVFVFDADAEGLSDPPVILLPGQLLERLETHERRSAERSTLLLNGHVYMYRGQAYVLPTLYRVPRERTPLAP